MNEHLNPHHESNQIIFEAYQKSCNKSTKKNVFIGERPLKTRSRPSGRYDGVSKASDIAIKNI